MEKMGNRFREVIPRTWQMEEPGFKFSRNASEAMSFLKVFLSLKPEALTVKTNSLWNVAKFVSSADQPGRDGIHEV